MSRTGANGCTAPPAGRGGVAGSGTAECAVASVTAGCSGRIRSTGSVIIVLLLGSAWIAVSASETVEDSWGSWAFSAVSVVRLRLLALDIMVVGSSWPLPFAF